MTTISTFQMNVIAIFWWVFIGGLFLVTCGLMEWMENVKAEKRKKQINITVGQINLTVKQTTLNDEQV